MDEPSNLFHECCIGDGQELPVLETPEDMDLEHISDNSSDADIPLFNDDENGEAQEQEAEVNDNNADHEDSANPMGLLSNLAPRDITPYDSDDSVNCSDKAPPLKKKPRISHTSTQKPRRLFETANGQCDDDKSAETNEGFVPNGVKPAEDSSTTDMYEIVPKKACKIPYPKHSRKRASKETSKDRLLVWIEHYSSEKYGIWVECNECQKWRWVDEYEEYHQVPRIWKCSMNKDESMRSCSVPEKIEGFEFSKTEFIPGSVVWAKLVSYPWWPAMIEDDPDREEYYEENEKTHQITSYHVTFLDEKVTRAWIPAAFIRPFLKKEKLPKLIGKSQSLVPLLEMAQNRAADALSLTLPERLKRYSFAFLYTGKWATVDKESAEIGNIESNLNETQMMMKEVDDLDSLHSLQLDSSDETNAEKEFQTTADSSFANYKAFDDSVKELRDNGTLFCSTQSSQGMIGQETKEESKLKKKCKLMKKSRESQDENKKRRVIAKKPKVSKSSVGMQKKANKVQDEIVDMTDNINTTTRENSEKMNQSDTLHNKVVSSKQWKLPTKNKVTVPKSGGDILKAPKKKTGSTKKQVSSDEGDRISKFVVQLLASSVNDNVEKEIAPMKQVATNSVRDECYPSDVIQPSPVAKSQYTRGNDNEKENVKPVKAKKRKEAKASTVEKPAGGFGGHLKKFKMPVKEREISTNVTEMKKKQEAIQKPKAKPKGFQPPVASSLNASCCKKLLNVVNDNRISKTFVEQKANENVPFVAKPIDVLDSDDSNPFDYD